MIIWVPVYIFYQYPCWLNSDHEPILDDQKPLYFLNREEAESIVIMMQLVEPEELYDINKVEVDENDIEDVSKWNILVYTDDEIIKYYGQDFYNKHFL